MDPETEDTCYAEDVTPRRPWSSFAGLLAFALFPIFGVACGSLLGIDAPTDRDASSVVDAGTETALTCTSGQKVCSGLCVAKNDPNVGCGGNCSGCPGGTNAASSCVLKNDVFSCGITCNPGFGSCDGTPGCAAQLNTIKFCGTCTNDCRADGGLDYCVPGVGGPFCSPTCPPQNTVCPSGECVDVQTNPKACGAGCQDCTLLNGKGTCEAGVCKVACNDHFCGPTCAPSTDSACWSPTGCVSCAPGHCDQISGGCSQYVDAGGIDAWSMDAWTIDASGMDACTNLGTHENCAFCGDTCGSSVPCCSAGGGSHSCGYPPPDSGPLPACVL